MSKQVDVLVIGSGVAGAMAAARAKERGFQVYHMAKSMGATGYSSGAIDTPVPEEAMGLFESLTRPLGFARVDSALTQMGTVKSCFMVQKSQAFDLSQCSKEALLGVVEFSGFPAFEAAPVAKMLGAQGFRAHPIRVDLKPAHQTCWKTYLEFAREFSAQDCLQAMASVQPGFAHLFFPAVLGLEAPIEFLKAVHGSELLGLSHSIPGLRLGNLLSAQVNKTTVVSFKREQNHITEVELETGEILKPRSVVLATGRFLSGGFTGTREAIFGLPLQDAELKVDQSLRPLDQFGEVFATNLFAARSQDEGMGKAIANGYQAGNLC